MVRFFVGASKKKERLRKIKKVFLKCGTHFLTIVYKRAVTSIGIVSSGPVALSLSLLFCCAVCTKGLLSLPLFLPLSVITCSNIDFGFGGVIEEKSN
jgi:hypothetical protein